LADLHDLGQKENKFEAKFLFFLLFVHCFALLFTFVNFKDWMDAQTLEYIPLMTNITLGKIWLKQMADAALRHGITIQYCMSLSRHILQSLENTAVTQARVTNDYMTDWNYRKIAF
jgi:hypothetical protein